MKVMVEVEAVGLVLWVQVVLVVQRRMETTRAAKREEPKLVITGSRF